MEPLNYVKCDFSLQSFNDYFAMGWVESVNSVYDPDAAKRVSTNIQTRMVVIFHEMLGWIERSAPLVIY